MRSHRLLACAAVVGLMTPALAEAQDWRSLFQSRAVSGEEALRVDIAYGAGRLALRPAADGVLYRANLRYDADLFSPRIDYDSGELEIDFEGTDRGGVSGRNMRAGNLDVALPTGVPVDLELKFGAAEAQLDLGGIPLSRARISTGASKTVLTVSQPNTRTCEVFEIEVGAAQFEATGLGNLRAEQFRLSGGVGEVTLDFTGAWETDMTADIEMGLGSLTLRLPRGLGVRVRKEGILAGFDSEGLTKRGDVYFSENWDQADRRLTVNLDAALGAIRVAWVDG